MVSLHNLSPIKSSISYMSPSLIGKILRSDSGCIMYGTSYMSPSYMSPSLIGKILRSDSGCIMYGTSYMSPQFRW